jgi:hypothetical protein
MSERFDCMCRVEKMSLKCRTFETNLLERALSLARSDRHTMTKEDGEDLSKCIDIPLSHPLTHPPSPVYKRFGPNRQTKRMYASQSASLACGKPTQTERKKQAEREIGKGETAMCVSHRKTPR